MSEKWIVAKPGGPAGPFWSIVSSSGRVIAMQIPDEAIANEIVALRAQVTEMEEAIAWAHRAHQYMRHNIGTIARFGQRLLDEAPRAVQP